MCGATYVCNGTFQGLHTTRRDLDPHCVTVFHWIITLIPREGVRIPLSPRYLYRKNWIQLRMVLFKNLSYVEFFQHGWSTLFDWNTCQVHTRVCLIQLILNEIESKALTPRTVASSYSDTCPLRRSCQGGRNNDFYFSVWIISVNPVESAASVFHYHII